MVTITATGEGTCGLTGKEGEGVYCEFTEGCDYRGFLTWAALKQLVVMHATNRNGSSESTEQFQVLDTLE